MSHRAEKGIDQTEAITLSLSDALSIGGQEAEMVFDALPEVQLELQELAEIVSNRRTILLIGVGGQGGHVLEYIKQMELSHVQLLGVNTDVKDLDKLQEKGIPTFQIGSAFLHGNGAGGDASNGENAMLDRAEALREMIQQAVDREDNPVGVCFVITGLGGGTGSGAAPVISRICRSIKMVDDRQPNHSEINAMGLPTYGVVTTPRYVDGPERRAIAEEALRKMQETCRCILPVDNDRMSDCQNCTVQEEYDLIDSRIASAVQSLHVVITSTPRENADLNDFIKMTGPKLLPENQSETPELTAWLILMGMSRMRMENEGASVKELDERGRLTPEIRDFLRRLVDEALNSSTLLYKNLHGVRNVLFHVQTGEETLNFTKKRDYMKWYISSKAKKTLGEIDFIASGGATSELAENEIQLILVATNFEDVNPLSVYRESWEREKERLMVVAEAEFAQDIEEEAPKVKEQKSQEIQTAYRDLQGKLVASPGRAIPFEVKRVAAKTADVSVERVKDGEDHRNLFTENNDFKVDGKSTIVEDAGERAASADDENLMRFFQG